MSINAKFVMKNIQIWYQLGENHHLVQNVDRKTFLKKFQSLPALIHRNQKKEEVQVQLVPAVAAVPVPLVVYEPVRL